MNTLEIMEAEVDKIVEIFPNIPRDSIQSILEKVPEGESDLRLALTLRHFFKQEEKSTRETVEAENIIFANSIVSLFPEYEYRKVMIKLQKHGTLKGRRELILKNILRKREVTLALLSNQIGVDLLDTLDLTTQQDYSETSDQEVSIVEEPDETEINEADTTNNRLDSILSIIERVVTNNEINTKPEVDVNTEEFQEILNNLRNNEGQSSPKKIKLDIPKYNINSLGEPIPSTSKEVFGVSQPSTSFSQDTKDSDNNSTNGITGNWYSLVEDLGSVVPLDLEQIRSYCREKELDEGIWPGTDRMMNILNDLNELANQNPNSTSEVAHPDENLSNNDQNTNAIPKKDVDMKVVNALKEMFPDACPEYVYNLCSSVASGADKNALLDYLINKMLETDYPKRPVKEKTPERDIDVEEKLTILLEMFPQADPSYLRRKCEEYDNDDIGYKAFINYTLEHHDYPTMKEYLRKQKLTAQLKQYTSEFNVENFVKLFPNPSSVFSDPKRTIKFDHNSRYYFEHVLRNKFDIISVKNITNAIQRYHWKVIPTIRYLEFLVKDKQIMKTKRRHVELPHTENIPLLQELAFITHEGEIVNYIKTLQENAKKEREEAKQNGLLLTCGCCYDEEVMPKDIFHCEGSCNFCKECVQKSVEVLFGEGKLDFPCLAACGAEFNLQTLQSVCPPNLFSKIAQKKVVLEVKAAGIEDLEGCPFCDFATIPAEGDKIFRCLNPDCMKESCRECKEMSHVPLRCDEVEKDEEVKRRVYIENKMTEALLRKCWKCGVQFYKEEGCNKMTCSCGAKMCYVCKQPVKDYSHFNGMGGDKHHLCPLYSDSVQLNAEAVIKGAESAKQEVGATNGALKIDPTQGLQTHFAKATRKLPKQPHLNAYRNFPPMPHHGYNFNRHPHPHHHHNHYFHNLNNHHQGNHQHPGRYGMAPPQQNVPYHDRGCACGHCNNHAHY